MIILLKKSRAEIRHCIDRPMPSNDNASPEQKLQIARLATAAAMIDALFFGIQNMDPGDAKYALNEIQSRMNTTIEHFINRETGAQNDRERTRNP